MQDMDDDGGDFTKYGTKHAVFNYASLEGKRVSVAGDVEGIGEFWVRENPSGAMLVEFAAEECSERGVIQTRFFLTPEEVRAIQRDESGKADFTVSIIRQAS